MPERPAPTIKTSKYSVLVRSKSASVSIEAPSSTRPGRATWGALAQGTKRRYRAARPMENQRTERKLAAILAGDVIIEGDDIYGDGVNIASRLESLADPGGIFVSRAVRDSVRDKLGIVLEDLGEKPVKNITRPVRIFRIGRANGGEPRSPPAVPDKPSIAVLPFANMSGDAEQEYFSDGISEDLITDLS